MAGRASGFLHELEASFDASIAPKRTSLRTISHGR